ncbi:MAG: hypothetical protein AB1797_00905 [bacterium]
MKRNDIKQQRIALLSLIKGYKKTNKLIFAEKKERLSRMSKEESLDEYKALCAMWEGISNKTGIERVSDLNLQILIRRRQQFDRAGKVK